MIADGLGLLDRVHVKASLHQKKHSHATQLVNAGVDAGMTKSCFMEWSEDTASCQQYRFADVQTMLVSLDYTKD